MSLFKSRLLFVALVLPMVLVACTPSGTPGGSASSPAGTSAAPTTTSSVAIDTTGATIIDVRTPSEYASGHLQGAVNIDIQGADFVTKIDAYPRDGHYVLYCRSGARASSAIVQMTSMGFKNLVNAGGIAAASKATGLPIVT